MVEREACPGLPDPLPALRKCAETDREVMERGTRAFVSYVRGYREHQVGGVFCTSPQPCWLGKDHATRNPAAPRAHARGSRVHNLSVVQHWASGNCAR